MRATPGPARAGATTGLEGWAERRWPVVLAAIVLAGLALRLWGLRWGTPTRVDLHPDEIDYVIKYAQRLSLRNLDPGFLNYPGFMMYLIAGTCAALRRLGLLHEVWQVHVVGRAWSALLGTATIPAVYLLAREVGARAPGALLAALWAALLPYHVWESHVAVTDVPMTLWTVLTLYGAVRLLRRDHLGDWAAAGAFLGLATGSKYTAAMAAAALILAALLAPHPLERRLKGLATAAACALAACFAVTPYSFIRLPALLKAMAYERRHTMGHHYGFSNPAAGIQYHRYVYQLVAAWPFSLGFGLYLSAAIGTLWAAFTLDRRKAVVLGFGLLFFAVTGGWSLTPLRYYLPLLMIGALFAGVWQGDWLGSPDRRRRAAAAACVVLAGVYTGVFTWQTTRRYAHETRIDAERWLGSALRPGATVLMLGWERYLALPPRDSGIRVARGSERALLEPPDATAAYDLIEVSSLVYRRHFRHGNPGGIAAYEALRAPDGNFRLVKRFESDFLNKRLYQRLDPMFEGYFISPTLEFYAPAVPGAARD